MVACTKLKQRNEEKSEKQRGERDQINFIDLRFERLPVVGLSDLCCGNAMMAFTKPHQRKEEESEKQRGERDQIKFIDHR